MLPIEDHIKAKRSEIGQKIRRRKKIYLDTNYWIQLQQENKKTNPNDKTLLNIAKEIVDSKVCIFPISEINFWEVLKQEDKTSLMETLEIIDKLSSGIAIVTKEDLIKLEFLDFYYQRKGNLGLKVWTKAPFILGNNVVEALLQQAPSKSLQVSFFEFLSNQLLTEIIRRGFNGGAELPPFIYKDNVDKMNSDNIEYGYEHKSKMGLIQAELNGVIDCCKQLILDSINEDYQEKTGFVASEKERNTINFNVIRNLILYGFKTGKLTTQLPHIRIYAELHAAHRNDKGRRFKDGNDTMDFMHSCFALPYFDYFFTDKRLATLIKQIGFDKIYSCEVVHGAADAVNILKKIMADKSLPGA